MTLWGMWLYIRALPNPGPSLRGLTPSWIILLSVLVIDERGRKGLRDPLSVMPVNEDWSHILSGWSKIVVRLNQAN